VDEATKSKSGVAWTHAHSAGGVVLRPGPAGYEFVAIRPAGHDRWQLPKGTIDRGETPEETAVREVREETGVQGRILHDLGNISYFFRVRGRPFHKQVDFFLMAYLGGNTADHDHEVDEAVWLPATAVSRLTFKSERDTVEKALALVGTGAVEPAALQLCPGAG
jgi:8-oxo-dGTP pyrophosphatase MutT (NUDIX family)